MARLQEARGMTRFGNILPKELVTNKRAQQFKLKTFEDRDVDVAIECCGVCASDLHTINGGWGDAPMPLCVGHEVIGKAIRVGKDVKTIKEGDRVGVGAQIQADLTCANCKADQENYCPNAIDTFGAQYSDGTLSQGGYSSHIRAHEYFTFKIPESIPSAVAAPMMCAGLTVYSPLVRLGAGPGKKVAVLGLGGLGKQPLIKMLEMTVIDLIFRPLCRHVGCGSRSRSLRSLALPQQEGRRLEDGRQGVHRDRRGELAQALRVHVMGRFHNVGFGDEPLPRINAQDFAPNGCYIGASHIGNRPEMLAMLDLASKQKITSWIEEIPISEEGCAKAVTKVSDGDVRTQLTAFHLMEDVIQLVHLLRPEVRLDNTTLRKFHHHLRERGSNWLQVTFRKANADQSAAEL
ncbi:NADPH-dependent medium chain alcohol dehydrogenase [Hortaea werneckii]|nr:NADPH-dependent medium chain alcohol dehydrogenase [Hortaea werneckii]